MDFFGIGSAIESVARIYFQSARATGRTTHLIESLKSGDRVVFASVGEINYFKRLLLERGITDVDCILVNVKELESLFDSTPSTGRTIFDHGWIEQYYLNAITRCGEDIEYFQRRTSGYGEAHYKTKRLASKFE